MQAEGFDHDALSYADNGGRIWTVSAVKHVRYTVEMIEDLFRPTSTAAAEGMAGASYRGKRRLVVIDRNVDDLHGKRIRRYFELHDMRATVIPLPSGEACKSYGTALQVIDAMEEFGIDRRREPVVAIGGGVLMDVVGFAASIYRRGTPYIRIPTTLIGLVDAGVGVKSGVNYRSGKNRLGTYAPAETTFLDRTFLNTLSSRHLSNGISEILKMALVRSENLFATLESVGRDVLEDRFRGTTPDLESAAKWILTEAVHLMLEELQPNLWEAELERCVDFGHSFSPTIEMRALPSLLHGEAVSLDMALTTAISLRRGYLVDDEATRIYRTMADLGLPLWDPILESRGLLLQALADTIRHRDGKQRIPLVTGIGRYEFANDITDEEIRSAIHWLAGASLEYSKPGAEQIIR